MDLEGVGSFGLVYEHRDPCNVVSLMQLGFTVIAFAFTYPVWWTGLFGIIVASMGYYGSVQPVIQSKVSFIQLYYFGNWFMLVLQIVSSAVLMIIVSEWEEFDLWAWVVLILGSMCLMIQLYVTYLAIQRSHSYRAELMRNPPPAENVYSTMGGGSTAVYTSMAAGYKAPTEVKTI